MIHIASAPISDATSKWQPCARCGAVLREWAEEQLSLFGLASAEPTWFPEGAPVNQLPNGTTFWEPGQKPTCKEHDAWLGTPPQHS
jgi:hypothetical protein